MTLGLLFDGLLLVVTLLVLLWTWRMTVSSGRSFTGRGWTILAFFIWLLEVSLAFLAQKGDFSTAVVDPLLPILTALRIAGLLILFRGIVLLSRALSHRERERSSLLRGQEELQFDSQQQEERYRDLLDSYQRLEQEAHFDRLTGLPNKEHFVSHLRGLLKRAKRHSQRVVLFRIRIEGMSGPSEKINRQARNSVLRELGTRLSMGVRESDPIGRLEGADFVVAMDDPQAAKDSHLVAGNLAKVLFKPLQRGQKRIGILGHIGIAFYPEDALDPDQMLDKADSALLKAQATKKNPFAFFNTAWSDRLSREQRLISDLKAAMKEDNLTLYFHPQVEIATGRIATVEALACWHHPERGLMQPSAFLPLAEEAGLRAALGESILEKACSQLLQWKSRISTHLQLAVNLSAAQLRSTDGVTQIEQILKRTGFPPERLILEVPSDLLALEHEACLPQLEALKALGAHLALDNFGGTLTHLGVLDRLGVHTLKLSPHLLQKVDTSARSQTLVRALLALASNLSRGAVVDGIETSEQCHIASQWGATLGQGSYWTRPLQPEHILPLLEEGTLQPGNRMAFHYT